MEIRISPRYLSSFLGLAIQINISPRFSSEERAVPRVVILRRFVRKRTEDEPGHIWYLNFTRLRIYGGVSSNLYRRSIGTSSGFELMNSGDKRQPTFERCARTGSSGYEFPHWKISQARMNIGLKDTWCDILWLRACAACVPISSNWHLEWCTEEGSWGFWYMNEDRLSSNDTSFNGGVQ